MTDGGKYSFVPPGSPTAAQFHKPNTLGPAVQGGPSSSVRSTTPIELISRTTETQASSANTVVSQRNSGVGVALAVGGVLLVFAGGAGAFFALKGGPAVAEVPTTPSAHAVTTPSSAPPPEPTTVAPPPVTASAAPPASATVTVATSVRLDVVTEPAGATLFKNGFQVCDTTPCEVTADPNETLSLEARKGAQKGAAKVLAQRDQKVTIKLAGGGGAKPAGGPRMCEVEVDGLKILRPCQ
jgi:hypothetical protein